MSLARRGNLRPRVYTVTSAAQRAAWVAGGKSRAGEARTLRTQAAEEVIPPAYLPPTDRTPEFPGVDGYLYGERNTCRTCGRNLRRTESLFRECRYCEENPEPLPSKERPACTCVLAAFGSHEYVCGGTR